MMSFIVSAIEQFTYNLYSDTDEVGVGNFRVGLPLIRRLLMSGNTVRARFTSPTAEKSYKSISTH
jgi:hypothetical protein